MTQYLLAMYQPTGGSLPPEKLEPIMRDLDAINQELKAAGAWVFAGGLHDAEHGHRRAGATAARCS